MTLTSIWTNLTTYTTGLDQQGVQSTLGIKEIALISALNSRAKFDRTDVPIPERQILGDATETGLTRFASQHPDFDELEQNFPKVFEIPFNSETKLAISIHRKAHDNGDWTVYVKGAPERVLNLCTTILTAQDQALSLTGDHEAAFHEAYREMAGQGNRVLAFAQCLLPGDTYPSNYTFDKTNCPMENWCFVGLAALEDPPKRGVREAIGKCRSAGIKVMMVTGDHPLTAEAIARKINLMLGDTKEMVAKRTGKQTVQEHEYNAIVIHGDHIDTLSDAEWDAIFSKDEIIFARTSPKHKLEIVKRAQSLNHIVAVTGKVIYR
jgi:sodium/potassium-transporting ATPase subunit alpha